MFQDNSILSSIGELVSLVKAQQKDMQELQQRLDRYQAAQQQQMTTVSNEVQLIEERVSGRLQRTLADFSKEECILHPLFCYKVARTTVSTPTQGVLLEGILVKAPVFQKVNNAIHRINLYPLVSTIGVLNTYALESDLSGGQRHSAFEQTRLGVELLSCDDNFCCFCQDTAFRFSFCDQVQCSFIETLRTFVCFVISCSLHKLQTRLTQQS